MKSVFQKAILTVSLCCSLSAWAWGPGIQMAVVDEAWPQLQEALVRQFPDATAPYTNQEWERVKTFAYGGSLAPDKDFYELMDKDFLFSDLAHCFFTGDLAQTIRASATTPEEVAFAWGWLSGCLVDLYGTCNLINSLAGQLDGSGYVTPAQNDLLIRKTKLFLDAYWLLDQDRLLTFCPSLMNRAYQQVYGIDFSSSSNFFNPPPHTQLIRAGFGEFRRAWTTTADRRTHTTRGGITYKIMTQANKISIAFQIFYAPSKFGPVEEVFNRDRGSNERNLMIIFDHIVDIFRQYLATPERTLANLTLDLATPFLEDQGYGYSLRGFKAWQQFGGQFGRLTPERAALMQEYQRRYLP